MDYSTIQIYGHLLSDDILHSIERDNNFTGNTQQDYSIDVAVEQNIDYVWSSLRNDWNFYKERSLANDIYGTRRARDFISRLLTNLGYQLAQQTANINIEGRSYDITYLAPALDAMPVIVVGDQTGDEQKDTLDRNSLDYRAKGAQRRRSPHATMLEYLNSTENVYGIVANGQNLRIIRNTGQLVKLTYIEFDLRRMLEEDKYSEFRLMFRLLHASRFRTVGDNPCVMERWFNMSIESGNRIRAGLSAAVQRAMECIGSAALKNNGEGNEAMRHAFTEGEINAAALNKELIHFIYRLLFLFIIEDRGLVYQIPDRESDDYARLCHHNDIYNRYYAATRFRGLSEVNHMYNSLNADLWQGLMDTFRLFEDESFGEKLSIKPLGGVLFNPETLYWLKQCTISNKDVLLAFSALNQFRDERDQIVKINYSALDVEEFGSVYEGILEMKPFVQPAAEAQNWQFGFVGGLDRQSTSSYYTRPDLVQNLIRTTLEPVIKERIAKLKTPEEKVQSLLSMKVCDAASGSGHIVLAMARTIAWYVSTIRTGEDNPASLDYREALREVIARCVYAVDYNPDAVELCKVVLWIEGYCAGKPLSFLDHHIRCGNSVVGVTKLDTLLDGVPKEAFSAVDNDTKREIVRINREALRDVQLVRDGRRAGIQIALFGGSHTIQHIGEEQVGLAEKVKEISDLPETSLLEQITKQQKWEDLMESPRVECLRRACDVFTYSFYHNFKPDDVAETWDEEQNKFVLPGIPYTRTVYQALEEIKWIDEGQPDDTIFTPLSDDFKERAMEIAHQQRFFHWCVEFPEVFAYDGGFDVMCGNPPWDRIKVEDKKWFERQGRMDIVNAGTAAQRKRAIAALEQTDPQLFALYQTAQANAESLSRFVRFSGRFKLTAVGDIDLYPLFAEHCMNLTKEAWGLVLPTGIAINDSNKAFFGKLVDENRLISLYDFENREALFDIHRMFKFCLLTAGKSSDKPRKVSGGFFLTRIDQLLDPRRIYEMNTSDFALLNPNTKNCPIFRTSRDAILTANIYHKAQVLVNESTGDNPWNIRLARMLDMSNDSHLFKTYQQLIDEGYSLIGNIFKTDSEIYVPLYEGKMIWYYNHHYGTWPTEGDRPNAIETPSVEELSDTNSNIMPWFWAPLSVVNERLSKTDNEGNVIWEWKHSWSIVFRKISNSTNERTFVPSFVSYPMGISASIIILYIDNIINASMLLAQMSSIVFDYFARQKMGGSNMANFITEQLPVLAPSQIPTEFQWSIVKRVAMLSYFNHDLDGWLGRRDVGRDERGPTCRIAAVGQQATVHLRPRPPCCTAGRA